MEEQIEKKWCVYIHTSPSGKRYIGITGQNKPEYRWKNGNGYLGMDEHGNYYQPAMARAIIKYSDWNEWQHEIIAQNITHKEAKQLECMLIELYKTKDSQYGYNLTDGGDGSQGRQVSDETKQKISNALKGKMAGEKNPMYGVHRFGKDAPMYGVHRYGKDNPMYGNHKMTGQNNPNCKYRYCLELDEIFWGAKEAADKYGISRACIDACCAGLQHSSGKHPVTGEKLTWFYVHDKSKRDGTYIKGAISLGYITQEDFDNYIKQFKEVKGE